MMKLSIIIVSYNTKDLTLQCIQSIVKQYKDRLENKEFELILVDNASTDATVETIEQFNNPIINNIKLIQNKENYGFSKGNNIGAKAAKGKYVLFLNSDTEVKDNGLVGMTEFLDNHKNVGVLGGGMDAGNFYNLFYVFLMLFGAERLGVGRFCPKEEKAVDWVSGAALMIRKELLKKLNGFDERLFMYMEDMELCFRAREKGYLTYFYPNISIDHREQGSSNRQFAILHIYSGLLYFYKKHKGPLEYMLVKLLLITKALIAFLLGFVLRNNYLTTTYKKALILSL